MARLNKTIGNARFCKPIAAGNGMYQCIDGATSYVVNLVDRFCGCGRWTVSGLPCIHAAACIKHTRDGLEDYCHSAYSVDAFKKCYASIIKPMADTSEIPLPEEGEILQPPKIKRLPGRPRKARKRGADEGPATQRASSVKCSRCGEWGHNKKTCQGGPTAKEMKAATKRKEPASGGNNVTGPSNAKKKPRKTPTAPISQPLATPHTQASQTQAPLVTTTPHTRGRRVAATSAGGSVGRGTGRGSGKAKVAVSAPAAGPALRSGRGKAFKPPRASANRGRGRGK